MLLAAFHQTLIPTGSVLVATLIALVPVVVLLALLAAFRLTAWLAVLIGSLVTVALGWLVWQAPLGGAVQAYAYGAATGFWNVDWIVFWGVVVFNTLVVSGLFERFQNWMVAQATMDVRVQAILLAWAFGALLEGLVGFGYPWAVVAPLLVAFGVAEIEAIRVAAVANNAPVSYGALGAPIIALATVTGLPLLSLSASVGKVVAILALAPPWILIYLVSGWRGIRGGWPLAVVGSLAYIAGQFPISQFVNPYLPDVVGALVCFGALLVLLRFWRPKETLGFGGVVLAGPEASPTMRPRPVGGGSTPPAGTRRDVWLGLAPFAILVVVVALWTGPWSPLPKYIPYAVKAGFVSSLTGKAGTVAFSWAPAVAGTSILVSWLLILVFAMVATGFRPSQLGEVFRRTLRQMWGALLVGVLIFGLAYVFNWSGMGNSMANGFSKIGTAYILLVAIVGWIGVALSGSNTSTNTLFGAFQKTVGTLLHFPILLLPTLNSVGAEIGKPVAPQTASVGVSTTGYVRNEGSVIRHNMGWTLVILAYLILIGLLFYFFLPQAMS
ncbi:MAG: L-lactate permease [Candidatus Dormibacteraeota bacterium]|nr:L-lactate permease [Candidatus Dormibacteraeota bacterium]